MSLVRDVYHAVKALFVTWDDEVEDYLHRGEDGLSEDVAEKFGLPQDIERETYNGV